MPDTRTTPPMSAEEMAEALRLAQQIVAQYGKSPNVISENWTSGRIDSLALARALIACREPVEIPIPPRIVQLNAGASWEHKDCLGVIKWKDRHCSWCGRPITWK